MNARFFLSVLIMTALLAACSPIGIPLAEAYSFNPDQGLDDRIVSLDGVPAPEAAVNSPAMKPAVVKSVESLDAGFARTVKSPSSLDAGFARTVRYKTSLDVGFASVER